MSFTGSINGLGYQVLYSGVVGSGGMGFAVFPVPPLPQNPRYGVLLLVLDQPSPAYRFVGASRSVFRDGVILFPPYPGIQYDVVFVARQEALGKNFYLQL